MAKKRKRAQQDQGTTAEPEDWGNPVVYGLNHWNAQKYPPVEHGADTAPTKLTVNKPIKMWASGLLSSQEWSGQFYRYIRPAFLYAADKAHQKVPWWHFSSIIECLQHDQRIPAKHLKALLAIRLDGMSWQAAQEQFHCTQGDLAKAERYINRQYLPARKVA